LEWTYRPQERDERRHLRRAQVLAVCRHLAAALEHLSDQLIVCLAPCDVIERRATLATLATQRVAVAALLVLKD
jgi:hypothetical protein